MTTLLTAAIILLQAVEPHRVLTEAKYAPRQRNVIWKINLYQGEGSEYVPVPGAVAQNYRLDFAKAAVSREKRVKTLPRDRSDMAEIVMERVLIPYVSLARDECSVKDELPWRSFSVDTFQGVASFEFAGLPFLPTMDHRGVIHCESHEVALHQEENQKLGETIRSILRLLNELTAWFDDLGVINGEVVAGGSR